MNSKKLIGIVSSSLYLNYLIPGIIKKGICKMFPINDISFEIQKEIINFMYSTHIEYRITIISNNKHVAYIKIDNKGRIKYDNKYIEKICNHRFKINDIPSQYNNKIRSTTSIFSCNRNDRFLNEFENKLIFADLLIERKKKIMLLKKAGLCHDIVSYINEYLPIYMINTSQKPIMKQAIDAFIHPSIENN